MTDCSSMHGSTSSSSDLPLSHHSSTSHRGSASPRIRIVRLCRPNTSTRRTLIGQQNISYGFSIRGGREYAIGFFVSSVEKGSEADLKGLRIGDQIIRVNGYLVDDAVHKELSQYMSSQDRLILKVRDVGMLPIKERTTDPLTWHFVSLGRHNTIHQQEGLDEFSSCQDVRITLNVAPRTKLGLGICKGPEWKPGIFVQFTKEVGIAREAGLRPGDQLLCCNDIDFTDILFSEAVAVMKSSNTLSLIVRTSAGVDLFPGESSGYNSSASSVTGDQSPCWGDQASKRLSIVREEDGLERTGQARPKYWERNDLDKIKERLCAVEPPIAPKSFNNKNSTNSSLPSGNNNANNNNNNNNHENNTTIIKLSDSGTIINNTVIPNTFNNPHKEKQSTTVHLDSHGENVRINDINSKNNIRVNINNNNASNNICKCEEQSSANTLANNTNSTKLADICFVSRQCETKTVIVEVHRGPNNPTNDVGKSSPPPPPPPLLHQQPINGELAAERSSSLSSSLSVPSSCDGNSSSGGTSLSSAISEEWKRRKERTKYNNGDDSIVNDANKQQNMPKRKTHFTAAPFGDKQNDEKHNALMDEFKKAHQKMFKKDLQRKDDEYKTIPMENQSHPATPLPDYDVSATNTLNRNESQCLPKKTIVGNKILLNGGSVKGTLGRCAASEMAKASGDAAEMESIDSYNLTNPSSPDPKPPSLYFNPQSTGPPTMKKSNKPVSISIGEYCAERKDPNKFEFFLNPVVKKIDNGNIDNPSDELKYELENALISSNLKTKSENEIDNKSTSINNKDEKTRKLSNAKPLLHKTQSNVEKITAMFTGHKNNDNNNSHSRVTINIPTTTTTNPINNNKQRLKKTDSAPINGILKNGLISSSASGYHHHNHHHHYNNGNSEHKNISFGKITTVTADEIS